jgi:hypothetical protein
MSFTTDTVSKHFFRPQQYFQDPELCAVMTDGVTTKRCEDVTDKDMRGGLREANWARNVVVYTCDPRHDLNMLTRYIGGLQALSHKKLEDFVWSCDFGMESGKKCHSFTVRGFAHLITESTHQFADKLSPEAKALIHSAAAPYMDGPYGVASRIQQQTERRANFDQMIPEGALRGRLLSDDEEISPKKTGKLLLEIHNPEECKALLEQYFAALVRNPTNSLAKVLVKHFEDHLASYSKTYKIDLEPTIRALCEAGIRDFYRALELSEQPR